jgi:hypothetical protein
MFSQIDNKSWRRCEMLWSYLPDFKETKSVGLITYSHNMNTGKETVGLPICTTGKLGVRILTLFFL